MSNRRILGLGSVCSSAVMRLFDGSSEGKNDNNRGHK